MFPGSICVSGFATPVVNCGTARVPMRVRHCKIHKHKKRRVVIKRGVDSSSSRDQASGGSLGAVRGL